VVSPVPPVHSPGGRSPVRPTVNPQLLHINQQPITGCHVAAHDWATWHLNHQPKHTTCQLLIGPHVCHVNCHTATCQSACFPVSLPYCSVSLPHQLLTSPHATCHPYSGDTCHLGIGPTVRPNVQICLTHVVSWSCHVSPVWTCHVSVRTCHVSVRTDCTDCTVSKFFFACLTYRTERDIFSIRSPFDKVNIPPESGRRDRRNGIGFVTFRELSFLSIFQALSGFWIQFRIMTKT
jgi:hypothetical protein